MTRCCPASPSRKTLLAGLVAILGLPVLLAGCANSTTQHRADGLVFLTREGCVNSERMRSSLDAALMSMKSRVGYAVVDQDKLPESDRRRGYPTPTVLYNGRDLFGLAEPTPPLPEPT